MVAPRFGVAATGLFRPVDYKKAESEKPVGRAREGIVTCLTKCARPTGGSDGLTTDDPAQRFKGIMRRPRQQRDERSSAAKGSIKAGAPKSPGPMIPTPTSLRQSPRSTQRLTTPTDGTPP